MHVGDRVPADTRIIALKTATLRAEQASLTGESVAVLKSVEAVQEEGCELQAKVRSPDSVPSRPHSSGNAVSLQLRPNNGHIEMLVLHLVSRFAAVAAGEQ